MCWRVRQQVTTDHENPEKRSIMKKCAPCMGCVCHVSKHHSTVTSVFELTVAFFSQSVLRELRPETSHLSSPRQVPRSKMTGTVPLPALGMISNSMFNNGMASMAQAGGPRWKIPFCIEVRPERHPRSAVITFGCDMSSLTISHTTTVQHVLH